MSCSWLYRLSMISHCNTIPCIITYHSLTCDLYYSFLFCHLLLLFILLNTSTAIHYDNDDDYTGILPQEVFSTSRVLNMFYPNIKSLWYDLPSQLFINNYSYCTFGHIEYATSFAVIIFIRHSFLYSAITLYHHIDT